MKSSAKARKAPPSSTCITSPVQDYLDKLQQRLQKMNSGTVATYIPELGKADPDWFGVCLVSADGQVYEAGNTQKTFTIQSISKPFTYGLALEDHGREQILKKVWVEPSGEAFNSISLDPATGRPLNPMINAGAIATTSLVRGKTAQQKIHRILDAFTRYTGRRLEVDDKVYGSESDTGHRNRAIAHMLRNFDIITEEPTSGLEAYFMQCSILVNCRDLGIMAATLANAGVNPVTGEVAAKREHVESMLSVMSSCGMYDAAGEWVYNVGMPAKSGVAGGILAVLPGQLGIGVFSPRLDSHGNSVRGIEVCREISRSFDLHMFNTPPLRKSSIRRKVKANEVGSNRLRHKKEAEILQAFGGRIVKIEIQGELTFATAEVVVREAVDTAAEWDCLMLDFGHVQMADEAAAQLLTDLAARMAPADKKLVLTAVDHLSDLKQSMQKKFKQLSPRRVRIFQDADLAMEWCENELIESRIKRPHSNHRVSLKDCELLTGFLQEQLEVIFKLLVSKNFRKGSRIIRTGERADKFYFLVKGKVSVWVPIGKKAKKRLATFLPGMAFGEMAVLENSTRSADIKADSDIECYVFPVKKLQELAKEHPLIMIRLLNNISLVMAGRLRKANREISILCR